MSLRIATNEILLVEDNPGDVRLTQEAFAQAQVHTQLWVARDGETALAMLRGEKPHDHVPRPNLVLLDLNLPGRGGLEVLEMLKSEPDLRSVPVIVLSSSQTERDVLASYALHANCYVTKPVDFAEFVDVVKMIEKFWFTVATLPDAVR
ncbi:MAG: response regulator [Gaiellales bacterium]